MADVVVYGADWCEDTQHAREYLNRLDVAHDYVNIERDEQAREWVKRENAGKERKPLITVKGELLKVPEEHELKTALEKHRLIQ